MGKNINIINFHSTEYSLYITNDGTSIFYKYGLKGEVCSDIILFALSNRPFLFF